MQTGEYLQVLGIVQYRRRELDLRVPEPVIDHPAKEVDSAIQGAAIDKGLATNKVTQRPDRVTQRPGHASAVAGNADPIPAAVADRENFAALADKQISDQQPGFDLLIWKVDKLLVWEFSQGQSELLSAKHRLINNVLKALWPSGFQGVKVQQQSWPVSGADASKASANNWLNSMLSGHLQQGAPVPVWLMGTIGQELLLGDQDSSEDPLGCRVKHPLLDIDLFVGPSAQTMFENPVAKAQTWQMLRTLMNR